MPLRAYYTRRRLEGLALEAWLHFFARREHGKREDAPKTLRVKENGVYVERDRDYDERIGDALDKVGPIARKVVDALRKAGVGLRGAGCGAAPPRSGDRCVDLRVRFAPGGGAGQRVLVEVKWSPLRLVKARPRARRELSKLRALRGGGRWRGPHPRAGKRVQAPFVGTLCVCQARWHLELWGQSEDDGQPDVDRSGRIRFQPHGAANRKKYGYGKKAAEKTTEDDHPEDSEESDDDPESEQDDDPESEQEDDAGDGPDSPDPEGAQADDAGIETDSSDGSC